MSHVQESLHKQSPWSSQPRADEKEDRENEAETGTKKRKLEEDQYPKRQKFQDFVGSGNTARSS
ncbi:unnamed protein product [Sphacelaria rigidula]